MVMWAIVDLSEEEIIPSMLVKVVDDVNDKKDHNFLETILEAHTLLQVGVLIGEAVKVPSSWPWQECPGKVTNQCRQEGS